MKVNKLYLILSVAFLFASCEKEEPLWNLPPRDASEKMDVVNIGTDYSNVIYFKLSTGNSVQRVLSSWDIAFASADSENHVMLNGGIMVRVYSTNDTNFATASLPATPTWLWDNPNGDKDSTAIGHWFDETNHVSLNKVYIVDWEPNPYLTGSVQKKKLKLLNVNATHYTIQFANMDNSDFVVTDIAKNKASNFTYFNLRTKSTTLYEPPTHDWDFVFTRYRHIYYNEDPITPYQVNGTLINTKYTLVKTVAESHSPYTEMDITKAMALTLKDKQDEIGFDWKYFDFTTAKYLIRSDRYYILKDGEGYFYKLKFIDFYNASGEKGFPKFVYQQL